MPKTVQDYITQRLYDNGKSAQQVPSALWRFNRRMHELEEEIVTFVNNDLYTEAISLDLDDWVNTYDLPGGNSINDDDPLIPQLKKLLEVAVRYDDLQTMPTKCREFSRDNYNAPETRYETYQTTLTPLFWFKGKQIVIYPTPTADVTDGLILRYAKSTVDAELTTDEDELPFARFYINAILVGMSVDLAKANKDSNLQLYMADRMRAKNQCLANLSDRYISATNHKNPDLTYLM